MPECFTSHTSIYTTSLDFTVLLQLKFWLDIKQAKYAQLDIAQHTINLRYQRR